jgi:Flp pilus assembly protein TadD
MQTDSRAFRTDSGLLCIVVLLLLFLSVNSSAQETVLDASHGSMAFTLTCVLNDVQGHPLSDVAIELSSAAQPMLHVRSITDSDGSVKFQGLRSASYDISVAGSLLLPSRRVKVDTPDTTVALRLPITLKQSARRDDVTVSVQQLNVPQEAQEVLHRAYQAWERNDPKRSRPLAVRALQLHPDYGAALSLLGILDLNDGHPDIAISSLQVALRYLPNSPRTYLALASALNALGRNDEALDALSIMAKVSPDIWQMRYEIGRAYVGMGRYQAAMGEFNLGQMLAQQDLLVLHVGKAHAFLGMRDNIAARAELEVVLQKSPDGPFAAESRHLISELDADPGKTAKNPEIIAERSASPHPVH